jgi:hypothetical protein
LQRVPFYCEFAFERPETTPTKLVLRIGRQCPKALHVYNSRILVILIPCKTLPKQSSNLHELIHRHLQYKLEKCSTDKNQSFINTAEA